MSLLEYYIESIPDLTLSRYEVFADSGIDGMIEAQTQFIRQLYRAALLGTVSIHFLFDYNPSRPDGKKISIRLIFQAPEENQAYLEKLRKLVKASGISGYFSFREATRPTHVEPVYTRMCYLRKKERFLQTVVDGAATYFYVVPNWTIKENARLYNIFKLMGSFDEPCCYRIDLFTRKDLDEQVHQAFEKPLTYLRNTSKRGPTLGDATWTDSDQKDPNANEVLRQYEDWLKAVDTAPIFLCRVCSFSRDEEYGQLLLDSVLSECLESGNGTLGFEKGNFTELEGMGDIPAGIHVCSDKTPKLMREWPIIFTLDEAAAFSRFPVLYDGENIELPKETSVARKDTGIILGIDGNGHNVRIPLRMLPKHMFVCGVPGAGKTNTMLHMANSLWNHEEPDSSGTPRKAHIPFLVLEPAKREYRELALFDIPELIVFSPSACTDFPLNLNPFEFPAGITLSEHIGKLCQVFEGAFPIPAPAPFILDRAIQAVYENLGWSASDINTGSGEKQFPTMSELYKQFEKELAQTNYDGEMKGNIRSVLEVRIGSLLRREMKDMFDVRKSTLSPEEWLKRPVIIELEALGEGPANFVTLLLCTLIREALKASPMADKDKPIRHVIFIEEAHNLISSESQADKPEDSNPKIAATSFIVKMLAEVRALREGIIIADQLPTAMAPEVIKNTNIKLVHRLTSQDDRELVGSTMSASPLQLENMATYVPGHALFTYEDMLRPFDMTVSEVPKHGEDTPDDIRLRELMMDERKHPHYVALRKEERAEKWNRVKEDILRFSKDCNELAASLDIPVKHMSEAQFGKYVETYNETYSKLEIRKNAMKLIVAGMSDFISEKAKNDAFLSIEQSMECCARVFKGVLQKWMIC